MVWSSNPWPLEAERMVPCMPDVAVVEQSDIEDMIAFLREKGGPVDLDTLVERYVSRLKERVTGEPQPETAQ